MPDGGADIEIGVRVVNGIKAPQPSIRMEKTVVPLGRDVERQHQDQKAQANVRGKGTCSDQDPVTA